MSSHEVFPCMLSPVVWPRLRFGSYTTWLLERAGDAKKCITPILLFGHGLTMRESSAILAPRSGQLHRPGAATIRKSTMASHFLRRSTSRGLPSLLRSVRGVDGCGDVQSGRTSELGHYMRSLCMRFLEATYYKTLLSQIPAASCRFRGAQQLLLSTSMLFRNVVLIETRSCWLFICTFSLILPVQSVGVWVSTKKPDPCVSFLRGGADCGSSKDCARLCSGTRPSRCSALFTLLQSTFHLRIGGFASVCEELL